MDEGHFYYTYAFHHGMLATVLAPHMGYYNGLVNIVSLLSVWLPMELAPYAFRWTMLGVWLLLVALLCLPSSPFKTPLGKALAVAVALFSTPASGMALTANLVCTNFYACLVALVALLSRPQEKKQVLFYNTVLAVAAISGPVSVFLLPLAVLQWWDERTRERALQCKILLAGIAVQLAAIAYSCTHPEFYAVAENPNFSLPQSHNGARFHGFAELDILSFWLFNRAILHPFGGWRMLNVGGHWFEGLRARHGVHYYVAWLSVVVAMAGWMRLMAGSAWRQCSIPALMTLAFFCVAVLSFFGGSVGAAHTKIRFMFDADRYFIVPSVVMGWAFIKNFETTQSRNMRWLYGGLVFVIIGVGLNIWALKTEKPYREPPLWSSEIGLWRKDPKHAIAIMSPWPMVLAPSTGGR